MKVVLQLIPLFLCFNLGTALTGGACSSCLWSAWRDSVSLAPEDVCDTRSVIDVWNCLNDCEPSPEDMPKTFPLRAMTQVLDILFHQAVYGCESFSDECFVMTACLTNGFAYYGGENATHAPYYTVFNYTCSDGVVDEANLCVQSSGCGNDDQQAKLIDLIQIAYIEACEVDRRCVLHGNIFEVFPGSNCEQYLQEALAYGPSTGNPRDTLEGLAFNTVHKNLCRSEFADSFTCPPDPEIFPILSEFKPSNESTPAPNRVVEIGSIQVDLAENCARCLHPLWDAIVTSNGSHVCDPGVEVLIFKCLDVCGNNEVDIPQRNIDALVKIADLHKALQLNNCTMSVCTKMPSECYEKIARFHPSSAPHVTVNHFNCSEDALADMYECFSENCPDGIPATLEDVIRKGFNAVCRSDKLCMSFGNLYELVSRDVLTAANITDDTICAYYTHAPANGYQLHARQIARSIQGLVFNIVKCQPDWPETFECPADLELVAPVTTVPTAPAEDTVEPIALTSPATEATEATNDNTSTSDTEAAP